jgi:hypothetical protein
MGDDELGLFVELQLQVKIPEPSSIALITSIFPLPIKQLGQF